MTPFVIQYNQIEDVADTHRYMVESVSGNSIDNLDIDDVNSFLNGLYLFHWEAEKDPWKNLS